MIGRIRDVAVAVFAATVAASPLAAQNGGYFQSDNLAYFGHVSCYTSRALALAHAAANCGVSTNVQRDLGISFVDGNFVFSPTVPTQAIFQTNNYSNVGNNPSNTNVGFVEMYDFNGTSVSDMSMVWDDSRTMFTLAASGGNTQLGCNGGDCSILWNGGTGANGGQFLTWNINAMFSGFTEATFNDATGMFESASDFSDLTGTLSGVFFDATTGRYYDLDAQLNADSWAVANGFATGNIAGGFAPVTATPEPASIALMATGLFAVGGVSLRRRKRKAQA